MLSSPTYCARKKKKKVKITQLLTFGQGQAASMPWAANKIAFHFYRDCFKYSLSIHNLLFSVTSGSFSPGKRLWGKLTAAGMFGRWVPRNYVLPTLKCLLHPVKQYASLNNMLPFCLLLFLLLAVGNIMDSLKFGGVNASPIWTSQKERGNLQYFQLQQHRSRERFSRRKQKTVTGIGKRNCSSAFRQDTENLQSQTICSSCLKLNLKIYRSWPWRKGLSGPTCACL